MSPKTVGFTGIKEVKFFSELDETSKRAFYRVAMFASIFGAKLKVINFGGGVEEKKNFDAWKVEWEHVEEVELLQPEQVSNITDAILEHNEDDRTDLVLAMVTNESRLHPDGEESFTKKVVRYSSHPIWVARKTLT